MDCKWKICIFLFPKRICFNVATFKQNPRTTCNNNKNNALRKTRIQLITYTVENRAFSTSK